MIVVSDSGPLIHLSRVNRLDILQVFFKEIYIPEAVYQELTSIEEDLPGSSEIKTFDWIKNKSVDKNTAKQILMEYLDEGESEAILLAKDLDADLLLIDDLAGRRTATTHGLKVMGTLGILDKASEENMIQNLEKVVTELRKKGFWMDDELFEKIVNG